MRATARDEVSAEDFYKPNMPIICAAHVISIADPAMYRQVLKRQREEWTMRLKSDGPSYPAMYRKSYNSQELYNTERKLQREKNEI